MAFDFKKEYKEFYSPKNKPEIVNVPPANYIAVRGVGNPNEEGGAYQQAIGVLYAVAYTLKMSYKTDHKIEGFFEYFHAYAWHIAAGNIDKDLFARIVDCYINNREMDESLKLEILHAISKGQICDE